ncbi:hypothetical protein CDL15_Pgr011703 [Punica granatum]|uniref:Uncharacterized protein n=1 Tax=Punica granatum TaxID=22663 RepID=A0A218WWR0_PUNGR|nr:hypothetical protein CDL15_Pgr011703 [Punica granatum]PKI60676.1 hypothetical protein CRG98_018923 [Punica granatum]
MNLTSPYIRRVIGAVRPPHGPEFDHRTGAAAIADQTRRTRRAWVRPDGLVELEFDHRTGAALRLDELVELGFDHRFGLSYNTS